MIDLDKAEFSVKCDDGIFSVTLLPVTEDSIWAAGSTFSMAVKNYLRGHPSTSSDDRQWICFHYDFMMRVLDKCAVGFPYAFMRKDFVELKNIVQKHIDNPRTVSQIYSPNSAFWWFMNTTMRTCFTCDESVIEGSGIRASIITEMCARLEANLSFAG